MSDGGRYGSCHIPHVDQHVGVARREKSYLELENILHTVEFLLKSAIGIHSQYNTLPGESRCLFREAPNIAMHSTSPPSSDQLRHQWLAIGAYLAENSSYVSSSCPERSLEVVPKLWARAAARVTGDCIRDRANWGALKKPVGRTARVAARKM